MDYLKYFQNNKYQLGKYDCWTFVQQVFKEEQNITLPDVPVFDSSNESFLKGNIRHNWLDKPCKGCLVFVKTNKLNHVGYAISEKEYMHKTSRTGVIVSKIPQNAEFYEVLK